MHRCSFSVDDRTVTIGEDYIVYLDDCDKVKPQYDVEELTISQLSNDSECDWNYVFEQLMKPINFSTITYLKLQVIAVGPKLKTLLAVRIPNLKFVDLMYIATIDCIPPQVTDLKLYLSVQSIDEYDKMTAEPINATTVSMSCDHPCAQLVINKLQSVKRIINPSQIYYQGETFAIGAARLEKLIWPESVKVLELNLFENELVQAQHLCSYLLKWFETIEIMVPRRSNVTISNCFSDEVRVCCCTVTKLGYKWSDAVLKQAFEASIKNDF